MKRKKNYLVTLGLAGALGVTGSAIAQDAPPQKSQKDKPARGVMADTIFEGRIDRIDMADRRIQVTNADGQQRIFHWDDSTSILGAELKEGSNVAVTFREQEGKAWATAIQVAESA